MTNLRRDKIAYVVGFLFNQTRKAVVLVHKQRPLWQKGKYNGVGGHIEPGEGPLGAVIREFEEETGVLHLSWHGFCVLEGDGFIVHFFRAFGEATGVSTQTDEEVDLHLTNFLPANVVPNVRWLIPMALSMDEDKAVRFRITEEY